MKLIITPLGHLALTDGTDYFIIEGLGELWCEIKFTSLDVKYLKN
jgi:hypothetical protein